MKNKRIAAVIVCLVIVPAVLIGTAYIYFSFFYEEPQYIADQAAVIEGVVIQPSRAVEIARPYLKDKATHVYRQDRELKTHLVKQGDWYYIMRTNYPAKSARYYMQPAVKVHVRTGEVAFSEKK